MCLTLSDTQRAVARTKRAVLLKQNREYQQKIWLWLHDAKRNKAADNKTETVNREQMKEQYKKTLEQLNTLWNRIEQTAEEASDQMLVLSADLKQADTKCRELNDAFKNFKRAIAREAKHSRNGKKKFHSKKSYIKRQKRKRKTF